MANENPISPLMNPVVQYGFAGFAVVLLGIIVWLMTSVMTLQKDVMALQKDTIQVIDRNTGAINEMITYSERTEAKIDKIYEQILSR